MKAYHEKGAPSDYDLDHFIPLELGGHPRSEKNLWPEAHHPTPGADEKDRVENWLHRQVCDGKMTLHEAQKAIGDEWYKVYLDMTAH